jgi:endoglycosylceramidase
MPGEFKAEQWPPELTPIHVDGNRFVDAAGREVILRGVNTGGRSKLPPFLPFDPEPDFETALDAYADAVRALGFNVVRLLVLYEAAEPVRGQFDETYLLKYDAMVRAFAERGIRVIVDAHQDLFSRRLCGDGFPDWALAEKHRDRPQNADCGKWALRYFTPPVAGSLDRLYLNRDGVQDSYVEFFAMLAKRYKDQPAVIGFEPINEPMPGMRGMADNYSFYKSLFDLYERVGEAVHSADPRYLIFADLCPLENLGAWTPYRPRPGVENLVLAPHYYDPGTFGISASSGGDQWIMRRGLKKHKQLGGRWNTPVIITEYGISPLHENAPAYINELYEVFDELKLSGTFWEASISETIWNEENTSLFNPDGSIRPASLFLDRPYPRAVAGTIGSFSFEPESGRFTLIWDEDPAVGSPTEVRLPRRVYADSPEVLIEPPSEFIFRPDRGLLIISSRGRESARSLEVKKVGSVL